MAPHVHGSIYLVLRRQNVSSLTVHLWRPSERVLMGHRGTSASGTPPPANVWRRRRIVRFIVPPTRSARRDHSAANRHVTRNRESARSIRASSVLLSHPVCGCDGKTYSSACNAKLNQQNVAYVGECGVTSRPTNFKVCMDKAECGLGSFCFKSGCRSVYGDRKSVV